MLSTSSILCRYLKVFVQSQFNTVGLQPVAWFIKRLHLGSEILGSLTPSTTPCHVRCIFPLLDKLLRRVGEHEGYPIDATSIWRIRPCDINITECIRLFTFTSSLTCNQDGRECSSKLGKYVARTRGAGENGSLLQ